jgi:alginate O-acetyltransferase complex protein AlgI
MLFCTSNFFYFFFAVFAVYWSLPWPRARIGLLLLASFYFYACWNLSLAWIVCLTSTFDYLLARGMDACDRPGRRKLLLYVSLAINLGLLVYFKYANFFLQSLETALRAAGAEASLPVLRVILPIGISFYTFEAINYMVDVYRRRIRAERDLAHFMLFILFFPHLVAGPIVRAKDFLPQIRRRKHWNWARAGLGMQLCLLGLIKKLAIADRMALYVDPVFNAPGQFHTGATWIAVLAYSIQIYCDFSGYSDMALGTAHLLGYRLALNFNMPYLSANISEFWRRWHMSLSTWLRDYVFMPLTLRGAKRRGPTSPSLARTVLGLLTGGARGSRWRAYSAMLTTMTICGLWHGASWTYAASGFIFGVMLVGHRLFEEFCKPRQWLAASLQTALGTALRVGVTFFSVSLVWVIFRAPTFGTAAKVVRHLFIPHRGLGEPLSTYGLWVTVALMAVAHIFGSRRNWPELWERVPAPVRGLAFGSAATLALVMTPPVNRLFVYFQF